jgi:Bacterial Ig-like domain (group 3)
VTTLTAKPRSANFGRPVTLTATVKNHGHARGTPAGNVTFQEGTTILGTVALHRGKASLRISRLPVGQDPIQVAYGGTGNFTPSTSAVLIETIRAGRSKNKAVGSQNLPRSEQAVPLTATSDHARAGTTIAPGIGTIPDGSTVLGTVPISDDTETSAGDLLGHANLVEAPRRAGHPRKATGLG